MEKEITPNATSRAAAFFALANHPFKLKLYLLSNLPAAFFSGVRVIKANEQSCTTSIPYNAFTKNPFRSTYFACLSMAAELSTGILAMASVYRRKPKVSMLVTGMEGRFYKKAIGKTFFTCSDGDKIRAAVEAAISTNVGQEVRVQSMGRNKANDLVAEFWFTWSFKAK